VYASTVPLNGSALFTLLIDSDGKLLSNTLGATSGDRESWARVARQTAQSLATRKLTVPKGRSVRLTVEVPSGFFRERLSQSAISRARLDDGTDDGDVLIMHGLVRAHDGAPSNAVTEPGSESFHLVLDSPHDFSRVSVVAVGYMAVAPGNMLPCRRT